MSIFLVGITGGFLGLVLATSGVHVDQWQFWAAMGVAIANYGIGLFARK